MCLSPRSNRFQLAEPHARRRPVRFRSPKTSPSFIPRAGRLDAVSSLHWYSGAPLECLRPQVADNSPGFAQGRSLRQKVENKLDGNTRALDHWFPHQDGWVNQDSILPLHVPFSDQSEYSAGVSEKSIVSMCSSADTTSWIIMVPNVEKNHRISTDGGVGRDLRDGTPKLFCGLSHSSGRRVGSVWPNSDTRFTSSWPPPYRRVVQLVSNHSRPADSSQRALSIFVHV